MSYQGTINGRMSRHGNYLGSPSRPITPKPAPQPAPPHTGCYPGCFYYTDSCFRKDCKHTPA